MHVILGAGGPVANALTAQLLAHGMPVRLASRRPVTTFANATWLQTDLTQEVNVLAAAQGASVLYLCAGLVYDKKVWAQQWPLIMNNAIAAAKATGARLLFFDNVYMYGHVEEPMREETPYHPASEKGKIRAMIASQLMNELSAGRVRGSIARAADFYGAESINSFYDSMVLQKFAKGQKALWLGNPHSKHAFTYVPDAAKGIFLLGQNEWSDGQVWHMPTARAKTGLAFLQIAADVLQAKMRYQKVSYNMLRMMGLFNKLVGETAELYYQYRYDYIFDSSKFEKAFGVAPVSYAEGIAAFKDSAAFKKKVV